MPDSSENLAQWNYEPALWNDFVEHETLQYQGSVRQVSRVMFWTVITAAVLAALFSVVPYLVMKRWGPDIWGPAFGIIVMAGICLAVCVIMREVRKDRIRKLSARTGEVTFRRNEIKINDIDLKWTYGDGTGWRFLDAKRDTAAVGSFKSFELIKVRLQADIPSKNQPYHEVVEWRIPIPFGREAEADRIIAQFTAEGSLSRALDDK